MRSIADRGAIAMNSRFVRIGLLLILVAGIAVVGVWFGGFILLLCVFSTSFTGFDGH